MNGRRSPDPPTTEAGDSGRDEIAVAAINGHRASSLDAETDEKKPKPSPSRSKQSSFDALPNANESIERHAVPAMNGDDNGGDSEAETLIDSPVKKKEAAKHNQPVKLERPPKHRIGSLPVPSGGDDDDDSAAVSPAPSTVMSVERGSDEGTGDGADRKDNGSNDGDDSDALSSPRSQPQSRGSSLERAESERPRSSHRGVSPPNPRKRKHRASSVSLPNKRPSIDVPRRRLRGLHSEELLDRSPSPKLRSHRRAVSTQSAFMEGGGDSIPRKRKAIAQGTSKETKVSRPGWEESDASSETTSHGQSDHKRLPRGISRSTSTPGRPAGREHKRHVNKYGFTRLAEACEDGNLDLVKEWREKDPDQLELAEFAGNKPLQIAALNGNVEVVDYLIDQGCQIDCANVDKDTPLIDAAENGHLDVVVSLLRAGVDPLRQNLKGQQALDAVTDETEDADEIRAALRKAIEAWNSNGAKQRREEEEELRHRAGPTKELHFMARTYENLLKLVQINDRTGVQEFLDARVPVDNAIIGAAAKTGDVYLVNMLLAEVPEKKRSQKPEKRILGVLGTSHFEMVKFMTELEDFNPHYQNRQGKSWPEIAEERRGPNWRQEKELLQNLFDQGISSKERRSSSPVSKRDSVKRRLISRTAEDEESEEDEAPRRKNGRKLMSKKEMRVARGKAASDGSSEETDSEMATGTEAAGESSMKPPESPVATRRTPTRSRTKSLSVQPPESSPRTRRRSSSFRAQGEQPLALVEEKENSNDAASDKHQDEEQKRAAQESEEIRESEIRKQEDEQKAQAAAAAAQRAAEEEAQRAEAARQEEEQRKAEEARIAEEQRKKEEEMREAARLHREAVIASLPDSISFVLGAASGFEYADATAPAYLIRHFAPLQVVKYESGGPPTAGLSGKDGQYWITNVQAAPFIGKQGVELMLRGDIPGFQGSLADRWETRDVFSDDSSSIECVLTSLPQDFFQTTREGDGNVLSPFEEQMERTAARVNATLSAKRRLREGEAVLRYVRLEDVLKHLHPALVGEAIEVRFDYLAPSSTRPDGIDQGDFVEKLGKLLDVRPGPRTYINGVPTNAHMTTISRGSTPVTIIHEK